MTGVYGYIKTLFEKQKTPIGTKTDKKIIARQKKECYNVKKLRRRRNDEQDRKNDNHR